MLSDSEITKENAESFAKMLSRLKTTAGSIAKAQFLEKRFGGE
jgi:hypothetical protein